MMINIPQIYYSRILCTFYAKSYPLSKSIYFYNPYSYPDISNILSGSTVCAKTILSLKHLRCFVNDTESYDAIMQLCDPIIKVNYPLVIVSKTREKKRKTCKHLPAKIPFVSSSFLSL